ncbi:MAG: hypothetical protein JRJ03_04555 [Deltaproteobacteria bacterium]|nr:hypothetical protein [Deltaproteobacteria bacterium]
MGQEISLQEVNRKVQEMKGKAEELKEMADDFPALYRNVARILASIKMLELNISDLVELELKA